MWVEVLVKPNAPTWRDQQCSRGPTLWDKKEFEGPVEGCKASMTGQIRCT